MTLITTICNDSRQALLPDLQPPPPSGPVAAAPTPTDGTEALPPPVHR